MNVFNQIVGERGFALRPQPALLGQPRLPVRLGPRRLVDHGDVVCHRPEPPVPPTDDDDEDEDDEGGSSGGNIDPDDDDGSFDDDDDDEDETLWTAGSCRAVTSDGHC